jgi:L-threonylcarbamoyladenylate synthase
MILSVEQAVDILKNSGVVAVPTETVYGLAGVATDKIAIEKIFKAKNRPRDNPLICHFSSFNQVKKYIDYFPRYFERLIEEFSPGPISYLLNLPPNSPLLPATGGLSKVIIRIPNHPIFQKIAKLIDLPLAAPSANTSTKFSATTSRMVEDDLGEKIAGVVEGGSSSFGLESTIIDCTNENLVQILRPGAIGLIELKNFFSKNNLNVDVQQLSQTKNIPGNKYRHYSPHTQISYFTDLKKIPTGAKVAILGIEKDIISLKSQSLANSNINLINLGKDLKEVAHDFYAKLYYLDSLNLDQAFITPFLKEKSSLWLALQNKIDKIIIQSKS